MSYKSYADLNPLDEISFIAGSTYYIDFAVYDENGVGASLVGSTWKWRLCPYGQPDVRLIEKTDAVGGGITFLGATLTLPQQARVTLSAADTLALSGKFIHQATFVKDSITYKPAQGVITIIPAIQ
jgi:hypothetical protein